MSWARTSTVLQLGQTLHSWSEEIVAMWRFTRNNGITEGFHNKMELINRQTYGFHNFQNYRLRVKVYLLRNQFGIRVCPRCWRRASKILEARVRIELTNKGFADLCLTTWLPRLGSCFHNIATTCSWTRIPVLVRAIW